MPLFKSSQEWLEKSTLLIEARPTTTRITTRYSIKPAPTRKAADETTGKTTDGSAKPPRGSLVITTYDPVIGVNLKYRTTKAAEVTRLVQTALGRLGRCMAGLPAECPEEAMPDAPVSGTVQGVGSDGKPDSGAGTSAQVGQAAQSAAGRRKKKGRK
ncbi:hypothetical protein E4U53_007115 [Claviceps sorghi]|nr:hypothetical protein E4U53_007115 [Claviceps sorghi]